MISSRRQFIIGGASAVLAIGFNAVQRRYLRWRVPPELLRPDTLVRFLDRAAIVRLGELYLRNTEHERGPRDILDALRSTLPGQADSSEVNWRPALDAACRADFSANRIVNLDGWVLSRTEARQCALLAALAT